QRFYANGFRLPTSHKLEATFPAWGSLSASARISQSLGNAVPISYTGTEIASYGFFDQPKIIYHAEYHPTDSLYDLYLLHPFNKTYSIEAGEFSLLSQYDPRLDVSLSRPITQFPGGSGPLADGKYGPLSTSGFVYGLRGTVSLGKTGTAMPYSDGWKVSGVVPFSNEVPCTGQPDFQSSPKGVFLEAFYRRGMSSYGADVFAGRDGRQYYGLVGQQKLGKFFLEGGAAVANFADTQTTLLSIAATWTPAWDKAAALRIDNQDGFIYYHPTLSYLVGGDTSALRLVVEGAITRGVAPSTTVSLEYKF
ncbi:MAG TPA: hypothetical protein VG944_01465, partial [Fimbriimonas sp.]|nr:hypothetical protein [Fimbriimonas sp.]